MLEHFVCCDQLFKMISDCKVINLKVRRDYTAIVTKFILTSIKFNNEQQESTVNDWENIRTDE